MAKIANIAKNTSYFTLALIGQKLISLAYFTIYARILGPEDLGKYYFAISFTTIFSIVLDLGLTNLLTRETAKNPEQAGKFLSSALGAKLILSAINLVLMTIIIGITGYSPLIITLIAVSVLSMIFDSFSNLFFAFSRAFHNLKYESISAVLAQAVTLIISLLVFKFNGGLVALMWAQVASSAFALLYSAIVIKSVWSLSLKPTWDWPFAKGLFLAALPFGLYAIAQRFYNYMDSVLLFQLAGDTAVGVYQIPFRAVNALQFLPIAFIASLYPALSNYWKNNRQQLVITFQRAMNYSLIIASPLAIGLAVLAPAVVKIFAHGFEPAVLPLQVSCLTIFFMFINYPIGSLLNACDKQKVNTRNMIITAVVSVVLNLILIPIWGVMGAVTTAVFSTALLFILNWLTALNIIAIIPVKIYHTLLKTLVASLLMAMVIYALINYLNVFVVVLIAMLVYFVALLAVGGLKPADLQSITKSFKK
ncbi:hypothetical protein COT94_04180 [Candidatus Falkowbacteria bacterium CG10_big_fil_rev_8_21_14_0_10_37_14]|uniref:Uncharacterized protein n=1 Tax=Candidatus Falkowbacteria bacterium CG10_big_fil_rev_8_21_14_0_10_37_14 TaxID=1974561 RepID=A0A2M6WSS2_9BACT|nr:flippase [Candidatus Falkowbacteria bacterium]PIT95756.1 MAG: hypothetical protein COT94_04180 [Candidatus Falkowbacteria bacterium CG10_big_fil_rev_8_21_14_0_10_37_14]